ncbi:hypothetical protein K1718_13405 [Roseibium porphyridii]|uniref:DUF4760 domain-containing protein n=1 Tax=Roseibium porphyridii TaxID=2866279 RepID=A0ABY8FAR8_9HYPH|nr:hypothetical protein [Roseibium sp. KMA01]WFE92316.1 hypothetical protein K1718_13405 [Roseibium sp. KMA01]
MKAGLVIFSGIWLLIGALLLSWSGLDGSGQPIKIFQGLTANELGDFLAGFFAPLAFIWLAAAVYIQSQELAEQRKELRLTRDVAEEAKEATKAQAEEARRSGNYFNLQTELMKEQKEREEKEVADQELSSLCTQIANVAYELYPNCTSSAGHELDRVCDVLRFFNNRDVSFWHSDLALEHNQLFMLFFRLQELLPKISASNRLQLGEYHTSAFFRDKPEQKGS